MNGSNETNIVPGSSAWHLRIQLIKSDTGVKVIKGRWLQIPSTIVHVSVTGQGPLLHDDVLSVNPTHPFPPFLGLGLVQDRVSLKTPMPQVTEQEPDHSVNPPSTKDKDAYFYQTKHFHPLFLTTNFTVPGQKLSQLARILFFSWHKTAQTRREAPIFLDTSPVWVWTRIAKSAARR